MINWEIFFYVLMLIWCLSSIVVCMEILGYKANWLYLTIIMYVYMYQYKQNLKKSKLEKQI